MAGKANKKQPSAYLRSGAAAGSVIIVTVLAILLERAMHVHAPAVLFLLPVIIAASAGGIIPGLVATLAGEGALFYLYAQPGQPMLGLDISEKLRLVIFPITGVMVSLLSGALFWSRQRINSIIDSITDCYMLLAFDWRVMDVNDRAAEFLRKSRREMIGQRLWELVPGLAESELGQELRRAMRDKTPLHIEKHVCESQWAELHLYPVNGSLSVYFRDITERINADRALRESEEKFRNMAENAQAMIGIVQDERFVYASPYLVEASGYSREELLSIDIEKLLHPDYRQLVLERARRRQAGEDMPTHYEYIMLTRDGREKWVDISLARITLQGRPAIIGIGYDITERKRFEEQLTRDKRDAENANQLKDQFLAALSHELRTPLTPVLLAAESLASDSSLPEPVRRELAMIGRNMAVEAHLIDDLLDLTRIARGKLELQREPVDAHQPIEEAIESCRRGDTKAAALQLRIELGAAEHYVNGSAPRIQQIVWNLLKNAIKFTPPGGQVTLRTRNARFNGQHPPPLVIEATDTGAGIEPDQLEQIFRPFEQGGAAVTRQFGGLGLGLAISRALAELHGGSITAFSAGPGQGSTFTVELPTIPAAEYERAQREKPPQATTQTRPARILVVEDHESTARILSQLLRASGHDVSVAGTFGEAMDLWNRQSFELVISDLGLPDGNGLDLMRQFKQMRHVRGIALSGYGMEEDVRKSYEAGFDEHLTKPINMTAVESAVARVMQ